MTVAGFVGYVLALIIHVGNDRRRFGDMAVKTLVVRR